MIILTILCVVKKVIKYIILPLSKIFNLSFQQGIFPDRMKIAKVIPLFKAVQKDAFTNYRPVSLLPQFSKILEKLFCVTLDNFIEHQFYWTSEEVGIHLALCKYFILT